MTKTNPAPAIQTLLALDFGIKKTGMALGNTLTNNAQPFGNLAMNNGQPDWDNLLGIIQSWQIAVIVIGLPLNMDGTDSMLSKRAAKFARRLAHKLTEHRLKTEVFLSDERLTSREARQLAFELGLIGSHKDPIDAISACLILRAYFEGNAIAIPGYQPNQASQ